MPGYLYQYIDLRMPLIAGGGGTPTDVGVKQDVYDIFQSIKNIILTFPGERPFSNIGGGLYEFKYEYMSPIQIVLLQQKILSSLSLLEPRAIINSINIKQTLPDTLQVEVNFSPVYDPALIVIRSMRI
jgi:phage baseplate assembly protein W